MGRAESGAAAPADLSRDASDLFFTEFNALLAFIRSRVEFVKSFREFLKQRPILVVVESKDVGAPGASTCVFEPLPKVSDDFRIFVAALRAKEGDGCVFSGGVGH